MQSKVLLLCRMLPFQSNHEVSLQSDCNGIAPDNNRRVVISKENSGNLCSNLPNVEQCLQNAEYWNLLKKSLPQNESTFVKSPHRAIPLRHHLPHVGLYSHRADRQAVEWWRQTWGHWGHPSATRSAQHSPPSGHRERMDEMLLCWHWRPLWPNSLGKKGKKKRLRKSGKHTLKSTRILCLFCNRLFWGTPQVSPDRVFTVGLSAGFWEGRRQWESVGQSFSTVPFMESSSSGWFQRLSSCSAKLFFNSWVPSTLWWHSCTVSLVIFSFRFCDSVLAGRWKHTFEELSGSTEGA